MQKTIYYIKRNNVKDMRRKKIFTIALLLVILYIFGRILFMHTSNNSENIIISPLQETFIQQIVNKTRSIINSRGDNANLAKIVLNVLGNDKNNYGVVIYNLTNGEQYHLNETKVFDTASLYKLWIMAVAYQQIEKHELSETDVLSDSISSLDTKFNLASDSAEQEDETITWPVQNALEQMIIISDNYSALLLAEKVKLSNVTNFLSENGLGESKVGAMGINPITTAHDAALFFEELYQGKLADADDTNEMLNLLKQQRINTKLPLDLPKNIVIAHKTGDWDDFSHDAGIIYTPKENYVIVILSRTNDALSANKNIAEISKNVYDYFSKK